MKFTGQLLFLGFQEVEQHSGDKCQIRGTKHHKGI